MMNMNMIGGMASGTKSLMQFTYGRRQEKKRRKELQKLKDARPLATRSDASAEREAMARNLSTQGLPGETNMKGQIGAASSRNAKAIGDVGGSASDVIAGLTASSANETQKLQDLGVRSASARRENLSNLQSTLSDVSDEQYQIRDYNYLKPWEEEVKEKKEQLSEAGKTKKEGWQGFAKSSETFAGGGSKGMGGKE